MTKAIAKSNNRQIRFVILPHWLDSEVGGEDRTTMRQT